MRVLCGQIMGLLRRPGTMLRVVRPVDLQVRSQLLDMSARNHDGKSRIKAPLIF